jgi:hypothetical protein
MLIPVTQVNAGAPAIAYGTSLPASPSDQALAVLVDSTTSPTYQWLFRYNAGSSLSYKWEFIGGGGAFVNIADPNNTISSQTQMGATGYYYPTSGTNSFAIPRAGNYVVDYSGIFDPANAPAGLAALGVFDTVPGIAGAAYTPLLSAAGQYACPSYSNNILCTVGNIRIGWTHPTPGTVMMRGGIMTVTPITVS